MSTEPNTGPAAGKTPLPNGHHAAVPASHIGSEVGSIAITDWDVMFDAVRARLIHGVGERLGELPHLPHHSAELSASLVQAVVLDCVSALDQLHAALQQERSQRPTP